MTEKNQEIDIDDEALELAAGGARTGDSGAGFINPVNTTRT